jgi:transposase
MSLDNRLHVYHTEQTIDAAFIEQSVKDFFEHCHDTKKPIVVVWDNGPVHHAKSLKANFEQWETLGRYFFYLPKYSPHLNPIEILWRRVKYTWLSKIDYKSWATLKKAILDRFKRFGSEYAINFNELVRTNMPFNSA